MYHIKRKQSYLHNQSRPSVVIVACKSDESIYSTLIDAKVSRHDVLLSLSVLCMEIHFSLV